MRLVKLSIDQIKPNPHQPRLVIDSQTIEELASSILSVGLLHLPLVHEHKSGEYELIAGQRRLLACQRLGWQEVDAWVIQASNPSHSAQAALVENLQRSDLNAMEIAHALDRLKREFGYSHEQIAQAIGKKRSSVSNYFRLLQLDPELQRAVQDQTLSFGHAKLLAVYEPTQQRRFLKKILKYQWSVHQLQRELQQVAGLPSKSSTSIASDKNWQELREALVKRYGLQARIHLKPSGQGYVKLQFSSPQDLHRLAYGLFNEEQYFSE